MAIFNSYVTNYQRVYLSCKKGGYDIMIHYDTLNDNHYDL